MSFDELRVVECHSSLNHLQCAPRCGSVEIWSSEDKKVDVDPETFRARRPLPSCPACGGLARPNVLMFGDFAWNPKRSNDRENRYEKWLSEHKLDGSYIVAIEFGAGTAIPTVRFECQRQARKLIRVNPRDYQVPQGAIALSMDALPALKALETEITNRH